MAGAAEPREREARREIQQRARCRQDRDAVQRRRVSFRQLPDAVDDHARTPSVRGRGHRDLGRRRAAWEQVEDVRVGEVAECGIVAAREHRGHVVREGRGRGVAEGVHPDVDANQAPVLEPALDLMAIDPRLDELLPTDPPVLAPRETRGRGVLAAHTES